jgi:lipopolysaccharide export system permease protein
MKVIERYIFGRAFWTFLGALTATLLIVWITQALLKINLVTTSGQTAATFLHIATLILPSIVPEVLPFAVAIAVAQTLSSMNSDSELVVINAAGAGRSAVARPILLLAFGASLMSFLFTNVVDPASKVEYRQLIASARADLISLVLQEGTFRQIEDGLYIEVNSQLPNGELGGIFVADSRQEDTDFVYYAKKGFLVDDPDRKLLVMKEGVVHRKAPTGEVSVVRFDSYTFDLSLFASSGRGITMSPKDRPLPYLFNPDPEDALFQKAPHRFLTEIHRRFAEWTYPFVFALVGLAVAGDARSHREGRVNPIITLMALCLIIRWMGFFTLDLAERPGLWLYSVYVAPLIPTIIALWCIKTGRSLELPMSWVDWIVSRVNRVSRFFASLGARMRGQRLPDRSVS